MLNKQWQFPNSLCLKDQKTILGILIFLLPLLLGWWIVQEPWVFHATSYPDYPYPESRRRELRFLIEPNTASKEELMLLPGIGETLAERMLEHRQNVAPFESPDDLELIRGIGPKKRAAIEPFLDIPPHSS